MYSNECGWRDYFSKDNSNADEREEMYDAFKCRMEAEENGEDIDDVYPWVDKNEDDVEYTNLETYHQVVNRQKLHAKARGYIPKIRPYNPNEVYKLRS